MVVKNTAFLDLTSKKWDKKVYRHHSGFELKEISARVVHQKDETAILRKAVNGMLPKNRMRRVRISRLRLYPGEDTGNDVIPPSSTNVRGIAM